MNQSLIPQSSNTCPAAEDLVAIAEKNIQDILQFAIKHSAEQAALVIFDTESPLAVILTESYKRCLPDARFIDFSTISPADIFATFKTLTPSDLVVLIQSTSFRLKDFRIRVELFEQSLKVIEHPYLARMQNKEELYYVEALAYDVEYFHGIGHRLKKLIDCAQHGRIEGMSERLTFNSPFEPAKLNIGDYTDMKNIGGQFPIGEVFTEAKTLEAVNGSVAIFAFADSSFNVNKPEHPITLIVKEGRIIDTINSTPEFNQVLEKIRADEDEIWLRELGFGMNRAFTRERIVRDIGTYERMCGIHLSLGAKHGVYKKSNFKRGKTWHHVDVFAVTQRVYLDNTLIFENGNWQI